MPNLNQINFIKLNKDYIKEPIAIIGSKEYEFDKYNYIKELNGMGFREIIGIDILEGKGVDIQADICDANESDLAEYANNFNTIFCMQMLYAVKNPFAAAENIQRLLKDSGVLIFSDVFTHRVNRIPTDYWRFTYDAQKILFNQIKFFEDRTKIGITRQGKLIDYALPLPELRKYKKSFQESSVAFFFRKLIRKLFSSSLLNNQRLLPEMSIHSVGKKENV